MTKSNIILGMPLAELKSLLIGNKLIKEQEDYIESHTFRCKEEPTEIFFGQRIAGWERFIPQLKIRLDDIVYLNRLFVEETKKVLGVDTDSLLTLMGITTDGTE